MPIRYCLAIFIYCAFIFWLSANPKPPGSEYKFEGADKIAHTVLYGGLTAVAAIGLRRSKRRYGRNALLFVPVALAGAYGLFDEIHQLWVPLRSFDLWDLAADAGSAMIVAWLFLRWWPPVTREPEAVAVE